MPSSTKVLTLGLLLGAAAGACYATHRSALRRLDTSHAAPPEMQTWEGEGGAVPAHGSKTARETSPIAMPTGGAPMEGRSSSTTTH